MRCRLVAPDMFANQKQHQVSFSSLFLISSLFVPHERQRAREGSAWSRGGRHTGENFPLCFRDAIWTFVFYSHILPLSGTVFQDLFAFSFIFMLPRLKNCQWLNVSFDIQKQQLEGFDWLRGWVAMVRAVIKAIKAAGVGLNGSSDCLRSHKWNRKGDVKQGRMGKTWKVR